MNEFNDHLLKFKITKDKLKMEISIKDLVWLFHNSPENETDGDQPYAKVKRGKRQEFAEFFVKMMLDDAPYEKDCFRWGEPFEDVFREISESAENFCKYASEVEK